MTPLRWPVRVWILAELLFGLFGASAVLLDPASTATNFAWPIRSAAAAAVLGAFYAAVALMLLPALFARTWEQVRAVVAAAGVLTSVMLLATCLHWGVFAHGSAAFGLWFVSYLVPPPSLLVLYVWQQSAVRPPPHFSRPSLPTWLSRALMVNGAMLAMVWIFIFFLPMVLAPLPEVVVRVYAGWFLGLALLLWLTGRAGTWTELRLPSLWLITLPGLLLVQLSRFPDQVAWTDPGLLLTALDLTALAVACGVLWLRYHGTTRRLAVVGTAGVGIFLVVIAVLPLLRPDLDVRARWVGEYARGSYGGLMTFAYLALGTGAMALALAFRRNPPSRRGGTLLALASLGAYVSAVFPQDDTATGHRTVPGTIREIALIPTFVLLLAALGLLTRTQGRPALVLYVAVLTLGALSLAAPADWKGIAGRAFDAAWTVWMLFAQVPGRAADQAGEEEPAWTPSSPWSSTTRVR